jgi:hypothetical protein
LAFADLTDYPADEVGVLTNDGAGVLSWEPGGGSLAFADLSDYPADEVGVLTNDGAGALSWEPGGGGVASFIDLDDVTATYAGAGGYTVKVNAGANGLEFVSVSAGGGVDFLVCQVFS